MSWRMDETYVKVTGQWKYLYQAVDRDGDIVDFLLRAKRDCAAARRLLEQAIGLRGIPEKITVDRRGATRPPSRAFEPTLVRRSNCAP